jgi:DNA mismatch repair ATPase MutS
MRLARAWLPWLFAKEPPVYSFTLHPRDESGFRALGELKNRGIGIAANTLGQSADHVRDFFAMLRTELAFYVGCVNLHEQLAGKGERLCRPSPVPADERRLAFRGLYDVCLRLTLNRRVVGNDADADGKDFLIVTGANQGGKSTFLRSVGLAQLMMQCGMFLPAESFCSSVCDSLFTHYKREEDIGMKSGKFDEEMSRMSEIVDHLTPFPMVLFNESFAATNEREGSEIARQITSVLLEKRVRMVFVTHLYEFARGFYERNEGSVLFLRADRQADGTRTFQLVEGEPLQTSFGEDLYRSIFGAESARPEPEGPRMRAAAQSRV